MAAALLKELNPDVQGQALVQSPEAFLASSESALAPYNLVVATQCTGARRGVFFVVSFLWVCTSRHGSDRLTLLVPPSIHTEAVLSKLAGACAAAHVPLLVARSYGLVGYLRCVKGKRRRRQHDTHSDRVMMMLCERPPPTIPQPPPQRRLQLSPGGHCIVDAKVGEENKQFYNLALAPEPLPAVQVKDGECVRSCGVVYRGGA